MKKKNIKAYNFLGGKVKKMLSFIGMIGLLLSSFIICEKTTVAVKEIDSLMIEIKEKQNDYKKEAIDAKIDKNTIIPGLNGKKIDIEKSYNNMKKIGTFNENYIIYNEIKPNITLNKNYDKYIIKGNPKKNMISLMFKVNENDNIENILNILEKNKTKATFFVEGKWFEKNNDLVTLLINKGHTIGNLSYNYDYYNTGFIWINNILKKIEKQDQNYCYITDNMEHLKACALQKNYTIKPSIITKNNPLIEIKKNINSGSLIELEINEKTIKELDLIIKYIKSKGYTIENIQNHLSENLE